MSSLITRRLLPNLRTLVHSSSLILNKASKTNYLNQCNSCLSSLDISVVGKPLGESATSVDCVDSESIELKSEIAKTINENDASVLDPTKDDLSNVTPYMMPTFNVAAYVNKSPALQELVKLGVNFHELERKPKVVEFLLRMDFNEKMKNIIRFLHDVGVPADRLGYYITKNPLIFKEELEDLQVRINYLQSKRFCPELIARVVSGSPAWLSFKTQDIDKQLGYFQKTFSLTGEEVRKVAFKRPRVITYSLDYIKVNVFVVREEMGFSREEMKKIFLEDPKLFTYDRNELWERFDYVHNTMKISHEQIADNARYLSSRVFRTKQRHMFLESLNRAQYNPKLENYVSAHMLVSGTDVEFCQNVAKTSIESFNTLLKTL